MEVSQMVDLGAKPAPQARVFISYAWEDIEVASWLHEELEDRGFDVMRDLRDTLPAEDWWQRVLEMIAHADTFLFLLSGPSSRSETCAREVEAALERHKRILPVVIEDVDWSIAPEGLGRFHSIRLRDSTKDKKAALAAIAEALETDIGWVREHTRIGEMAHSWTAGGQRSSRLLRGEDLRAAEKWLAGNPPPTLTPTAMQRTFIAAARRRESRQGALALFFGIAVALVITLTGVLSLAYRSDSQLNAARVALQEGRLLAAQTTFSAWARDPLSRLLRRTASARELASQMLDSPLVRTGPWLSGLPDGYVQDGSLEVIGGQIFGLISVRSDPTRTKSVLFRCGISMTSCVSQRLDPDYTTPILLVEGGRVLLGEAGSEGDGPPVRLLQLPMNGPVLDRRRPVALAAFPEIVGPVSEGEADWGAEDGTQLWQHCDPVPTYCIVTTVLDARATDKRFDVWERKEGENGEARWAQSFRGLYKPNLSSNSVALSRDGRRFAISANAEVRVWRRTDLVRGSALPWRTLRIDAEVHDLSFDEHGRQLVALTPEGLRVIQLDLRAEAESSASGAPLNPGPGSTDAENPDVLNVGPRLRLRRTAEGVMVRGAGPERLAIRGDPTALQMQQVDGSGVVSEQGRSWVFTDVGGTPHRQVVAGAVQIVAAGIIVTTEGCSLHAYSVAQRERKTVTMPQDICRPGGEDLELALSAAVEDRIVLSARQRDDSPRRLFLRIAAAGPTIAVIDKVAVAPVAGLEPIGDDPASTEDTALTTAASYAPAGGAEVVEMDLSSDVFLRRYRTDAGLRAALLRAHRAETLAMRPLRPGVYVFFLGDDGCPRSAKRQEDLVGGQASAIIATATEGVLRTRMWLRCVEGLAGDTDSYNRSLESAVADETGQRIFIGSFGIDGVLEWKRNEPGLWWHREAGSNGDTVKLTSTKLQASLRPTPTVDFSSLDTGGYGMSQGAFASKTGRLLFYWTWGGSMSNSFDVTVFDLNRKVAFKAGGQATELFDTVHNVTLSPNGRLALIYKYETGPELLDLDTQRGIPLPENVEDARFASNTVVELSFEGGAKTCWLVPEGDGLQVEFLLSWLKAQANAARRSQCA